MSIRKRVDDENVVVVDYNVLCRNERVLQLAETNQGHLVAATRSAIYLMCPVGSFCVLLVGHKSEVGFIDACGHAARINTPGGIAIDDDNHSIFFTDSGNHCVRVVEMNHDNNTTTIVGTGKSGYANGSFSEAMFHIPLGIAIGRPGVLFVSDCLNNAVRRIVLNPHCMFASGSVDTLCGPKPKNTACKNQCTIPDVSDQSPVCAPGALAVTADQNTLVVALLYSNSLHAIDLGCTPGMGYGRMTVLYENPSVVEGDTARSLSISRPSDFLIDGDGSFIIADNWNHRIIGIRGGVCRIIVDDVGPVCALAHISQSHGCEDDGGGIYFGMDTTDGECGISTAIGTSTQQPAHKKRNSSKLPHGFLELLDDVDSMDVLVELHHGSLVPAHALILKTRSTFFAKALQGVWDRAADSTGKRRVCLHDFDECIFEVCMHWMYGGDVMHLTGIRDTGSREEAVYDVCKILRCASFLDLGEVQTRVLALFHYEINPTNIMDILKILYDMDENESHERLTSITTQYLYNNIDNIIKQHVKWESYGLNDKLQKVMCKCLTTRLLSLGCSV